MRHHRAFGRLVRILILAALAGFWMGPPRPPGLPSCRGPRPPMPLDEPAGSILPTHDAGQR
jgi:hypothetical protein